MTVGKVAQGLGRGLKKVLYYKYSKQRGIMLKKLSAFDDSFTLEVMSDTILAACEFASNEGDADAVYAEWIVDGVDPDSDPDYTFDFLTFHTEWKTGK